MSNRNTTRYTLKHDNGIFDEELEIENLGFNGKFYRIEIRCTDPTDHGRMLTFGIPSMFGGNPTFKRAEECK